MCQIWDRQISGTPAMVLMCLADFARDDGSKVYPCVKTIMHKVGRKRRPVQRILDNLRRRGVLVVVKQGRGRGQTTIYRINLDALPRKPPPPIEDDR